MDDELLALVNDEIKEEMDKIKTLKFGSEEYQKGVETVAKLIDRQLEMEKALTDHDHKVREMDDEKKDRIVKNVLTAVSVLGGFGLTVWGTVYTTNFEKDDNYTTAISRMIINRLVPKK